MNGIIQKAFKEIRREDFVREEDRYLVDADIALPIGFGQTISQPYTVTVMLEMLKPEKGQKILDIGSGSGWTITLLAYIVGSQGKVIGLERVPELVQFGRNNLAKYSFSQAEIIEWSQIGYPGEAPYDRILVSAASDYVPTKLIEELKDDGILVMPINNSLIALRKKEGFVFVPLILK